MILSFWQPELFLTLPVQSLAQQSAIKEVRLLSPLDWNGDWLTGNSILCELFVSVSVKKGEKG